MLAWAGLRRAEAWVTLRSPAAQVRAGRADTGRPGRTGAGRAWRSAAGGTAEEWW